jgi:hypothetical protein
MTPKGLFDGLAVYDTANMISGFAKVIEGHTKLSKRGRYKDTQDAFLCIWGIGLANLAIYRGMRLNLDHSLIPKKLLKMNPRTNP